MSNLLNEELGKKKLEFDTKQTQIEDQSVLYSNLNMDMMGEGQMIEKSQTQESKKSERQTIFPTVEYKPGMFDHLVRTMSEEKHLEKTEKKSLRKQQQELIERTSHNEKDTFSLLDTLEQNPFKVYEWLKASAAVDGASDSFMELVNAYGKMLNAPEEAVYTAGIALTIAADNYLASHSKKPKHLYGRQRVLICNTIKERVDSWAANIAWQRQLQKDPSADYADRDNVKTDQLERLRNTVNAAEDSQSAAFIEACKALCKDKGREYDPKDFSNVFGRNTIEIMTGDVEWDKQWLSTYFEQESLMKQAKDGADNADEIAAIKQRRAVILDGLVDQVMSFTEEEAQRFLMEPEYFLANYARVTYLNKIAYLSSENQNKVDIDYFKEMNPTLRQRYEDRCQLIYNLNSMATTTIRNATGYFGTNFDSFSESRDTKDYEYKMGFYRIAKKEAFAYKTANKKIADWSKLQDEVKEYSINFLEDKFTHGNEKSIRKDAEKAYNNVNSFMEKNTKDGVLCLPPIDEVKNIILKGSIEDKFPLFLLLQQVLSVANAKGGEQKIVGLTPAYEAMYSTLNDQIMEMKSITDAPNEETDLAALSVKDAEKLGLMVAGFAKIAAEKVFSNIDREIKALVKSFAPDASAKEMEEAKREVVVRNMAGLDAQLLAHTNPLGAVAANDTIAGKIFVLAKSYMHDMDEFKETNVYEDRYFDIFMKSGTEFTKYTREIDAKTIKTGQENGSIRKDGDLIAEQNRPKEERLEKKLDYRTSDIHHILYDEAKKDAVHFETPKLNYIIKSDKKLDEEAKKKAKGVISPGNPKATVAKHFGAKSPAIAKSLADQSKLLYEYEGQYGGVAKFNRNDNYILYFLRQEDLNKNEKELSDEEKAIRKWNEKFTSNYKKCTDSYAVLMKPYNELVSMTKKFFEDNLTSISNKDEALRAIRYRDKDGDKGQQYIKSKIEDAKVRLEDESLDKDSKAKFMHQLEHYTDTLRHLENIISNNENITEQDTISMGNENKNKKDLLRGIIAGISSQDRKVTTIDAGMDLISVIKERVKEAEQNGLLENTKEFLENFDKQSEIIDAIYMDKDLPLSNAGEEELSKCKAAYKTNVEHREKLYGQITERFDEVMRFDISEEKICDINWVIENYDRLITYTSFTGNLSNMENGQVASGVGPDMILERMHKYPHYEVLNAKLTVFGDMNSLLSMIPQIMGVKYEQKTMEAKKLYMNKDLDDMKEKEDLIKEQMQHVYNRYKEYTKIRDSYIS